MAQNQVRSHGVVSSVRSGFEVSYTGSEVEMQSSGPADRPGSKFRPGQAFCGTRTESAGLMLGSGVVITMYYVLASGLRAVLERCLLGSMLG